MQLDKSLFIEESQTKIRKKRKQIDKLYGEIADIERSIRNNCDHKNTGPYTWEHDDGYGRQSQIKGKQCNYCHMIDLWNNGHFINRNDIKFSDYGGYQ